MSKPVPIFRGTLGLNDKLDPLRITYDVNSGAQELAECVNVDIDTSLRASRSKGYTKRVPISDAHSLFCGGNDILFASSTGLYTLQPDFSGYTKIATITQGSKVRYTQVNDVTLYVTGFEKGYIRNGVAYDWARPSTMPKPLNLAENSTYEFFDPPIGDNLCLYNGRVYVAQGGTLYFSWLYYYSHFRLATDRLGFNGNITMLCPVSDGIYVSDSKGAYFMSGDKASEMKLVRLPSWCGPAIDGTATLGDMVIRSTGQNVVTAMWMCNQGFCVGYSGGVVRNVTRDKLVIPPSQSGAALWKDGSYLALLNP